MTTIETSIPPYLLVLGLVTSIAFFVFLLHRELREQSWFVRLGIVSLRVILCVLLWWLIAQPRTVTERDESLPVRTKLGIDVSDSMTLADKYGVLTSRWNEEAPPDSIDEAITLTEAAKIRLNLISRRLESSKEKTLQEIEKTIDILAQAKAKTEAYDRDSEQKNLVSRPIIDITAAIESLHELDPEELIPTLARTTSLVTHATVALRRIAVLRSGQEIKNSGTNTASRIELVRRWMEISKPLLQRLATDSDLQVSTFASDLKPLEDKNGPTIPESGSAETQLYENLNLLAKQDRSNGSQIQLLITDGVDSANPELAEFSAEVRDQPLIVLPIGDPDRSSDTRVDSVISPAHIRKNDVFIAIAKVSAHHIRPITVTVELRDEERILDSHEVSLKGDGSSERVELQWKAIELGTKNMEVSVVPMNDESLILNNSQQLTCIVTDDRYRILLADSFPRWESRYLQSLFRRDPAIELASVIFEPRHTYPGNDPVEPPALPLSLETWQKFNIVILGDLNPTQLTPEHQELLVKYVNQGGNLMLLAGENAMPSAFVDAPLEELLPITQVQPGELEGNFVITPPENLSVNPMVRISGQTTASLWKSIFTVAPRYRISSWAKAKQSAQTLLVAKDLSTGATHDFLSVQRFGSGRVAFAAAPCFYHLRFRYGDRYHLRFWGNFIRGMCAHDFGFDGGMVKTRLDHPLWDFGKEVQGRVRIEDEQQIPVPDADFTAVATRDGEPIARVTPTADPANPGDYFIRFPDLPPGNYTITYEGGQVGQLWDMERQINPDPAECNFRILDQSLSGERQFATENSDFWSRVNDLPLAATIHPQTLPLMLDAIDIQPETFSLVRSRSIWDTWMLLSAIVLVSGFEWLLRRTQGLC